MGNLLIRNVPEEVVRRLKERARKNKRSLQQELIRILTEQMHETEEEIIDRIVKQSKEWRKNNRQFTDSVLLVREDRKR
jgi:plasmid stability protein